MAVWALLVVGAYLLGTFPTAALVGRTLGFDPTAGGSGNPGASNSLRLGGRRAGAAVLAGDAAKGALAAGAGLLAGGRALGFAAGAAAVVGHIAPVTRRPGGKGVATAGGMAVVLLPVAAGVAAATFAVVARLTRTASVASLAGVAALVAVVVVEGRPPGELAGVAAVAVLIVVRHRANLGRLVRGAEPSIERPRP